MGRKVCPKCKSFSDILESGPGNGEVTCRRCKGQGRVYNNSTWEYDECRDCRGIGKVECSKCDGTGWIDT